jgi:hypothetical protein
MNRQLKGFAAMNTIAENLRGRTAATREVEFAVNNSKENKAMFGIKRVAIGDGERGLLYKNRRFERVLAPGVYRLWDAFGVLEVRSFDITRPDFIGKDVDALIERLGAELELSFVLADIGVEEVGLVSKSGKLEDVLAPGMRKLYWKGLVSEDRQADGIRRFGRSPESAREVAINLMVPGRRQLLRTSIWGLT